MHFESFDLLSCFCGVCIGSLWVIGAELFILHRKLRNHRAVARSREKLLDREPFPTDWDEEVTKESARPDVR